MSKEIKWYNLADNIAQLDFQSNNVCRKPTAKKLL